MKILFYCNEYPPYPTGGIGSVTKIVAEELVKRGHEIFVVGYYPYNKTVPQYSCINGVKIYRLNLGLRDTKLKLKLFFLLLKIGLNHSIVQKELSYTEQFIESLIEKEHIDILELTDYYDFNACTRHKLYFRKFSVPTILKIHGSVSFLNGLIKKSKDIYYVNDERHFSRCQHLTAVSQYALSCFFDKYNTDNFETKNVIYNPLECNFFKEQPLSKSKDILFIGKLVETKGCYNLLRAFNAVYKKHPDWNLRLIGGGDINEAKKYLTLEAERNVIFLGYCDRETVQQAIDDCAFACIPSYFETFGMVATEIMSRSRALIFTNTTSGPEIIETNKTGLLVTPTDIEEIENSINLLIEDKDFRNLISKNAYESCFSRLQVSTIIDKIESQYKMIKRL